MTGGASFPPKGETHLLVLQPTSFCNIDCSYCYLPDRHIKARMSHDTLRKVLANLVHDDMLGGQVEILWHAGEPLTVGIDYYKAARDIIEATIPAGIKVRQAIQTNATLIDESWCDFFKEYEINVGVSLDGPQIHHDRHRRTRAGAGTFDRVMRSVRLLAEKGVDFYVISVLAKPALADADMLLDFAARNGIRRLCFNVEETEGIHVSPTLSDDGTLPLARRFYDALIRSAEESKPGAPWIREVYSMMWSVRASFSGPVFSDVNIPFRIVTVDTAGGWSTYCPELMALDSAEFGNFRLGNLAAGPISTHSRRDAFDALQAQIKAGVARCRAACEYFAVCGGGRPSNKYAEHRSFDVAATRHCDVAVKALADACVDHLERYMAAPAAPAAAAE